MNMSYVHIYIHIHIYKMCPHIYRYTVFVFSNICFSDNIVKLLIGKPDNNSSSVYFPKAASNQDCILINKQ